ncbi:MAG: sensor histidine kinase [Bacteroidetes bacterium]|nr:MAG: sensor histidine kinase [Bacteroidota bacterium]
MNKINDAERIEALNAYHILDSEEESQFNEMAELASLICEAPISLISLLDDKRQWFKAKVGLGIKETPIELSFCRHAIMQEGVFIVEDAIKDERFHANELVLGGPFIRFYAGMPLQTPQGVGLGTLCVIDSKPRQLSDSQKWALKILSNQVVKLLELRKAMFVVEKTNHELLNKQQELEKLIKFKNKVFSIISHDLRGPIGSISQVLGLLNNGMITSDEFVEVVPRLANQTNEARDVLNNLLSWANSNKPETEPLKKAINLNEGLEEIRKSLEESALRKEVVLLLDTAELPNSIRIDKEGLTIVLRNLIKNSIKFCRKGDEIRIGCEPKEGELLFYIKDTGVGFDETIGLKLFDEMQHVTTYGTANEKGTGIGLLICKNIVEKNGGKIWAESKAGQGANFYFTIPV